MNQLYLVGDFKARMNYTMQQRNKVNTFIDLIDSAFATESITVNYRKSFVKISLEDANVKNKYLATKLNNEFKTVGFSTEVKDQITIIKMPRNKITI